MAPVRFFQRRKASAGTVPAVACRAGRDAGGGSSGGDVPASGHAASGAGVGSDFGVRQRPCLRPSLSWPRATSGRLSCGCEGSGDSTRTPTRTQASSASAPPRQWGQQDHSSGSGSGSGDAHTDAAAGVGVQRALPAQGDSLHWVEKIMGAIGSPCACGLGWYPTESDPHGLRSSESPESHGRRRRPPSHS